MKNLLVRKIKLAKRNSLSLLALLTLSLCCLFNTPQSCLAQTTGDDTEVFEIEEPASKETKALSSKFISFSIGNGNQYNRNSSDKSMSYLLTFEKRGLFIKRGIFKDLEINDFFISGCYFNYHSAYVNKSSNVRRPYFGFGVRAGVDLVSLINEFSDGGFNLKGLEIQPGVQFGYTYSDHYSYYWYRGFSPKVFLNAKYYLGDKIGIKLELGRTAYTNANIGVCWKF